MKRVIGLQSSMVKVLLLITVLLVAFSSLSTGVAATSSSTTGKVKYKSYCNERYNFSVDVPADLIDQGPSGSGDGNTFKSKDGKTELKVWGGYNALEETPRQAMERYMGLEKGVVYTLKTATKTWYALSWSKKNVIHYQKSLMSKEYYAVFSLAYPQDQKERFDPIITHMVQTLALPEN